MTIYSVTEMWYLTHDTKTNDTKTKEEKTKRRKEGKEEERWTKKK